MSTSPSAVASRTLPGLLTARELLSAERVGRSKHLSLSLYPAATGLTGHCTLPSSRFGHVFLWDSGSSVGDIIGHSKFINSIDYRPTRPFRVATAGEDNSVGWFEGPPFRYKNAFKVCSLSFPLSSPPLPLLMFSSLLSPPLPSPAVFFPPVPSSPLLSPLLLFSSLLSPCFPLPSGM